MGIASPEVSDCLWSRTGGRGLELWRRWEGQFQLRSKYREKTGYASWARNASSLLSLLIHSFGNKGIVTLVRVWHIASLRLLFSSVKQSLFQGWCDVYAHKWCLGVLFCNSKLKCTGVVKTNCYCLNLASLPKFMLRLNSQHVSIGKCGSREVTESWRPGCWEWEQGPYEKAWQREFSLPPLWRHSPPPLWRSQDLF